MGKFETLESLVNYLRVIFGLSKDEAHDFAAYLIKGMHILWDTGWHCYVWPESLSFDDAYMHLENVQEERAALAETCPF